jgi:hypothetical protein
MAAFVCNQDDRDGWAQLLRFLVPITTATGPPIELW